MLDLFTLVRGPGLSINSTGDQIPRLKKTSWPQEDVDVTDVRT